MAQASWVIRGWGRPVLEGVLQHVVEHFLKRLLGISKHRADIRQGGIRSGVATMQDRGG